MLGGSYEHCDGDCFNGNTCPVSSGDCSLPLKTSTWRSLIHECDGRTGCTIEAGRYWSLTICPTRGRTDYMKIEYDCVHPSSSLSPPEAAAAAAVTTEMLNTASGWSNINLDHQGMSSDGQGSVLSGSVLISIIVIAGPLSHYLHSISVCLSVCL